MQLESRCSASSTSQWARIALFGRRPTARPSQGTPTVHLGAFGQARGSARCAITPSKVLTYSRARASRRGHTRTCRRQRTRARSRSSCRHQRGEALALQAHGHCADWAARATGCGFPAEAVKLLNHRGGVRHGHAGVRLPWRTLRCAASRPGLPPRGCRSRRFRCLQPGWRNL